MVKVINNYTLIEKIGEGNYGEVYRALNNKKQGEFAIKVISAEKFHQNRLLQQCTVNEIKILSAIGASEHIIKYQEHIQTKNNYYFVYQYCNGGTLLDAIKKQNHFQEAKALGIFRQLLQAFKVLNKFNVMHRDIKPENIFFNNGKIKLGDFGFCKGLEAGQYMATAMIGSPIYMAPQVLRGQKYTTKADVWSLGVVLYEMLFGDCPFNSSSIAMLITTIGKNQAVFPLQINQVSQSTLILLKKMLTKDYIRRINWVQLFSMKIDDQGNYIDFENTAKSSFTDSSKKSKQVSIIKECQQDAIFHEQKYPYIQKSQKKNRFYADKYLTSLRKELPQSYYSSQRKIDNTQNQIIQKQSYKNQNEEDKGYSSQKIIQEYHSPFDNFDEAKRQNLLLRHKQCIDNLKESLLRLQRKQTDAISQSYLTLTKVHSNLKEITDDILKTQTSLFDIACLVNYQIIQVSRQIIDTQHELQKRKIDSQKKHINFITTKSLDSQTCLYSQTFPFTMNNFSSISE